MSELALLSSLETSGALTLTGLQLPASITAEEYEALGAFLGRMHETTRWAIGDYILRGEELFGHDVYQLIESLGISEESRRQYVRVSQAIPLPRRREELSWSHHRAVVALEPDDQDAWLSRAILHGWSKSELDSQMRPQRVKFKETITGRLVYESEPIIVGEDGGETLVLIWLKERDGGTLTLTMQTQHEVIDG